ncbi:ABC transporter substrate-binding protein [Kribbella speibonae]|uniref:ABC transporter substrate-binding protein n=1 Tax=Kribbella speibonae TaxID=1572660 RepID=A0A4R0ITG0_9ACTN|nr:ABC transporter substrate-binding protein [Kribbella speibonae]TCC36397.1 ABC transporter substrate-binding protein [Kribbella speibonae]
MRRIHLASVVSIAALALTVGGCTSETGAGSAAAGASANGEKAQLTLAQTVDFYGWDPSNQPGYQGWAAEAVWDQLCKTDATGKAVPDIADTFETTNGNKTFKAHIRAGQTFTDGTPVDSAAVKASFEFASKNGGSQADYKGITIDTPDASNISITWPDPQGPVMDNKACAPKIVPAASVAAKKFDNPIGSGPYVLDTAASTTGSVYTFTKNEKHWNAKNYPYKKLVIKVITSDTAAVSALKTGQIDAVLVPQASLNEVQASGQKVIKFQGQTTRLLLTDHLGKVLKPIGNLKVRQAINMVFDKEAMAKSLYQGNAEPTPQVFRKGTDAYIENMQDPYPYDVDKAKALMTEAGYGGGFTMELPTMTGQNFETLMPYVTQQLAKINIKVKQVPLTGANAISDLLSGKYPVVLWQLGNLGNSALQIYVESTPKGWWNLEHQPDPTVDRLWTRITTAEPEESAKLQQQINQYQVDQAWFAPMVYNGTNYVYNPAKVAIPTESDQEALVPKLRDFK